MIGMATAKSTASDDARLLRHRLSEQLALCHRRANQFSQTMHRCNSTLATTKALLHASATSRRPAANSDGDGELVPGLSDMVDSRVAWQTTRVFAELLALAEARAELPDGNGHSHRQAEAWRKRLTLWQERTAGDSDIAFNSDNGYLTMQGRAVHLTRRESQLLTVFVNRPGIWMSAAELIVRAWRDDDLSQEQLRIYITRPRRRLSDLGAPWQIRSSPGQGYRLNLSPD